MDHQGILRAAVERRGTKPHPLRFLRADLPVQIGGPSQAQIVLAHQARHHLEDGTPILELGPSPKPFQEHAVLTQQASASGATASIRPLLVRGNGDGRALMMCDGSVLLARQKGRALHLWPGIADLHTMVPRPEGWQRGAPYTWTTKVLRGDSLHPSRLRLENQRTKSHVLDHKGSWGTDPEVGGIVERLRRCIDEVIEALGDARPGLVYDPSARGDTWPMWLPYQPLDEGAREKAREDVAEILPWLAAHHAGGARIVLECGMSYFSRSQLGPEENRMSCRWVPASGRGSGQTSLSLRTILDVPDLPAPVRQRLETLRLANQGVIYTRTRHERLPVPRLLSMPPVSSPGPIPDSMHARMEIFRTWGSPSDGLRALIGG